MVTDIEIFRFSHATGTRRAPPARAVGWRSISKFSMHYMEGVKSKSRGKQKFVVHEVN